MFLSPYPPPRRQIPEFYLEWAVTASFQILSISSFTTHPAIESAYFEILAGF
jgi:hypothetical protein